MTTLYNNKITATLMSIREVFRKHYMLPSDKTNPTHWCWKRDQRPYTSARTPKQHPSNHPENLSNRTATIINLKKCDCFYMGKQALHIFCKELKKSNYFYVKNVSYLSCWLSPRGWAKQKSSSCLPGLMGRHPGEAALVQHGNDALHNFPAHLFL